MKGFMLSHFLRKVLPASRPHAGSHVVSEDGWQWHLLPAAMAVPNLEHWIATGRALLVKENPARSVHRVSLPGGTVYVKHCRAWNFRAWAREVLRPAKARLEFENALELQARGIAAVEPLGWACRPTGGPGESLLLTRAVTAVPFLDFLEKALLESAPAARFRIAYELGHFLARMHRAGVGHPDPHPGNFMVERAADGSFHFTLIDVHAVRFGKRFEWNECAANLILFNRWFQLRSSRTDRLRFWRAYNQGRNGLVDLASNTTATERVREVEEATLDSNLRFWSGRVSNCLGKSRHFRKLTADSVRGFAVKDVPEAILKALLADPDAIFASPGVKLLKDSRTSTVAEWTVETPDGPRSLILKRFRVRKWWEPLKNLFRRSAALRSWVMGHTLRDRWLPTPRPLAVLHRVRHGVPAEGFLLTEKVPDALELPEAVRQLSQLPSADRVRLLRLWAFRIARLLRTLHARGGSHRDLKASNLILEGARTSLQNAVPVFIDLVGVRTGRPIPTSQRAKELTRLNASFLQTPLVTNTERLRFLKHYLLANLGHGSDWKRWWHAIQRATAAKVARNRRVGRPLA